MSDILNFIKDGRSIPNPNYDAKSKKKGEPKNIISNNIKDGVGAEQSASISMNQAIKKGFGLSQYGEPDKYADYGVSINPVNTEEELNKERATNQSILEQSGRFLTQAVGNEVVLGTALGLSNLVDMAINLGTEKGEDDYTNPFSLFIEGLQDDVKDRFEIYQKNPGESWAVGDFGWWASNAVSIASTASMLIPSTGIVKGLSLVGKAGKMSRISVGMAKAAKGLGLTKNTATTARAINHATEIGAMALLSRTMEGYMEARETYREVYDDSLSKLNAMIDEDKKKLIDRNPQFKDKTNEEIASYMSSVSADVTFQNDYAMLLMDVVQFKALSSLWKGVPNKASSIGLRTTNRNAIASLVDKGAETAEKATRLWRAKEALKSPFSAFAIQWTEGIEEGYQGIQSEKGKEVAEKIFNPAYSTKTMEDYIKDPVIWEQAFWGVLGGVGFQAIGTGLGNVGTKLKGKYDKHRLSDEEFALTQLTDEKIRELEIQGRKANMQAYVEAINTVNQGKNPYQNKVDPITKQPIVEDGNTVLEDLNKEEQEALKEQITNDFVTNMVLDATDKGNYDLLKEFITNPNFNKYFEEAGLETSVGDKKFSEILTSKMDSVYEHYSQSLYDVLNSIDVENEQVAKIMARSIARRNLNIQDVNTRISNLNDIINRDTTSNDNISAFEEQAKIEYANKLLNEVDKVEKQFLNMFNNKQISKQAYDQYIKDLNIRRNQLLEFASSSTAFGNTEETKIFLSKAIGERNTNDFINSFNEFTKQFNSIVNQDTNTAKPKESLQKLINDRIALEDDVHYMNYSLPKNQNEYQNEYDEISQSVDKTVIEKYNNAIDSVGDWLEKQDNIENAINDLFADKVPTLKKELDILKIGHHSTEQYVKQLDAIAKQISKDRAEKERKNKEVSTDNNNLSEKQAQETRADLEEIIPSTGKETETNTTPTTNIILDEVTQTTPEVIDDNIVVVPETEVTQDVELLDKAIADVIIKQDQELILNNDERAGGMASSIAFKLYRESKNLFDNLDGKDSTSAEFNKLVDIIAEELFIQGVSQGVTRQGAITGLKLALPVIGRKKGINNFIKLADSLSTKQYIESNNEDGKNAITTIIPDGEFNQVIEDFIEAYVNIRGVLSSPNNKTIINIADLFNELIENEEIGYEQAKYIFRNISAYISENRSKKYMFTNTDILRNNIKNPDTFFQQLREYRQSVEPITKYMHVPFPTKAKEENKVVARSLNNGSEITVVRTGNSLSFVANSTEIGYLGTVELSDDGNSLSLATQTRGFVRTVTRTSYGQYLDTFDDIFIPIIQRQQEGDFDKLYDAVLRQHQWNIGIKNGVANVSDVTNEMVSDVLNNEIIKEHINNGKILIPQYLTTDKQKAKYILNSINNVLFYDDLAVSEGELLDSYNDWKVNTYNNYKSTLELQNALKENKEIKVQVAGIKDGKVIISDDNTDISEMGFTHEQNPIIAVTSDDVIEVEGNNNSYSNRARFSVGTMGMLIKDNPDSPIVALFTESNKLNSNKALSASVSTELTNLFEQFYNGNLSFDQIGIALSDLFGGPGIATNNLFSGYSVIKTNDILSLNINGEKGKYTVTIYRNRKGSDTAGTGIVYTPNGDKTKAITSIKYSKSFVNNIVSEIVDNLEFNRTFFPIANNGKKDNLDNKYLYKENNKVVVNIGGTKTVYDSFGHFALANNAFKTNQGRNAEGGYFETETDITSIYINPAIVTLPVEEQITTTSIGLKELVENSTEDKPVASKQVLESAGVSKEQIDILSGNNEAEISLIPDVIQYDNKATRTNGIFRNGKVFITRNGLSKMLRNPKEATRILMHENFHKLLEETNMFAKENMIADLFDTYESFIKAIEIDTLNKDSANYKQAKAIFDGFINKGFSFETYGNNLSKAAKEVWNNKTEQERRQQFAEEWLVESITQPALIEYLNNTQYGEVKVDDVANKSIWQKIIDVLLKLFGKSSKVIENNTILAKQYSLLGEATQDITNEVSDVKTEDSTIDDTNNIETEVVVSDRTTDMLDSYTETEINTDKLEEDELFATTDIIETNDESYINAFDNNPELSPIGVSKISDMASYINRFDEVDKPAITKMINNNDIKFNCKR